MTRRIETDIENIRFNKAECGVDFLINTDVGCRLKYYYYGGKVYATDFFEILFFRESGGCIWIDDRQFEIAPNSVLFLSPYQRTKAGLERKIGRMIVKSIFGK